MESSVTKTTVWRHSAPWTALLFIALPATAAAAGWSGGGRAGLNMADLRGGSGMNSTWGTHAGLFVEHGFSDRFALDFELLYSAKGAEFDAAALDEFGKITGVETDRFRIHYLEVPALATVSLPLSRVVLARVLAGPVLGMSLGGRLESRSYPAGSRDLEDLRTIDIGVAGGAGLGFVAPAYEVSVDVRYTAGLLDSFEFGGDRELKHSVISMGLAVKWRFPPRQKG